MDSFTACYAMGLWNFPSCSLRPQKLIKWWNNHETGIKSDISKKKKLLKQSSAMKVREARLNRQELCAWAFSAHDSSVWCSWNVRSQSQSRHYMNQKIPRTSKYPLLHTRSEPEGKWKMPLLLWSHESHTPASKVHVTLQIKQGCPGDRGCCLSIFPEQS